MFASLVQLRQAYLDGARELSGLKASFSAAHQHDLLQATNASRPPANRPRSLRTYLDLVRLPQLIRSYHNVSPEPTFIGSCGLQFDLSRK